ncbi:putative Ig domain-containing protein [Labilibaculum filiforme]|uniref:putative Ig domain-containing protein n=1 Tax=Labilibaculum filiforme TaxID=1940526 RepID=UPI000C6DDB6E|nr:putative Ig domain-containing protein [Labilibaculum filiforme]
MKNRSIIALLLASLLLTSCFSNQEKIYKPKYAEGKYILTPKERETPRINGASVFGVRPGSPFLYTIPASGKRPIKFSVNNLPKGLQINQNTGVISGTITDKKTCNYNIVFKASNELGVDEKAFEIVVGDKICLTPPLGWNSWNCWRTKVDQEKVIASAKAMVDKGLMNYGWTYINIDDAWQELRGGQFNAIQGDPIKFPDIKAMCDEVHDMGLKIGIYSSPWVTTYAGFVGGSSDNKTGIWDVSMRTKETQKVKKYWQLGTYHFDESDAAQWAEWGIDYLKYDWNPNDPESTSRMAHALKNCGRDIIYSLSNTAPIEHANLFAKEVNCWRTAGDLNDLWDQESNHLNIRQQWERHRNWLEKGVRGGPGHFPDADMLVVGDVVTTSKTGKPIPSKLTADEQYTHISLWTLWNCPLLIGSPIESIDEFTMNLLTNPEVLEIHQDKIAIAGKSVFIEDGLEIIVKDLADGGKAIGLFNINEEERVINLDWDLAGLKGEKVIRDVWRHQDIGTFSNQFSASVRAHGVILLRISNS